MPAHTEARIRQLISDALTSTSEADVAQRVLPELRSALHEHLRLIKESVEAQTVILPKDRAA
jgi:hypothetical protein